MAVDFFAVPDELLFFAGELFFAVDFLAGELFFAVDFLAAPEELLFLAAELFFAVPDELLFFAVDFFAGELFFAVDFFAGELFFAVDFLAAPEELLFLAAEPFFAVPDELLFFAAPDELLFLAGAALAATALAEPVAAETPSLGSFFAPETTALRSAPALNFGTAVFLALIRSPVRGLRTHRDSRTRFSNEPNPVIATFSPLATSRVMVSSTDSRAWAACFRLPS